MPQVKASSLMIPSTASRCAGLMALLSRAPRSDPLRSGPFQRQRDRRRRDRAGQRTAPYFVNADNDTAAGAQILAFVVEAGWSWAAYRARSYSPRRQLRRISQISRSSLTESSQRRMVE